MSMLWNQPVEVDPSGNIIEKVAFDHNGNEGISKILCGLDRIDNGYASGIQIEDRANTMSDAMGVTLDGIILKPKLDQYMVNSTWTGNYIDNWFPGYDMTTTEVAEYRNTLTVDIDSCLGMISSSGEYFHSSAT